MSLSSVFKKVSDPLNLRKLMDPPQNKAGEEANRMEQQRRTNIANTTARINDAYRNPQREADIAGFLDATRQFYRGDLDRQHQATQRGLKFALARSGLIGGSVAADQGRTMGEDYQRGILQADRLAQGHANDLRNADEQTRMNLISMAQNGIDDAGAGMQAAQLMQANLAGAQSQLKANTLGDVFGGFGTLIKHSRDAAESRRANRDFYNLFYGSPSTRGR